MENNVNLNNKQNLYIQEKNIQFQINPKTK